MSDERVRTDVLNELRPGNGLVEADGSGLEEAIIDVAADFGLDVEQVRYWVKEAGL